MKKKEKSPDTKKADKNSKDAVPDEKDNLPEKNKETVSDKDDIPEKDEKKTSDVDETKENDKLDDESSLKNRESKGYKTIKIKNTFKEGQIYKGINTNVKAKNGSIFEIQYHTSESFNIKQNINHSLYEEYRLLDKTSPEALKLEQQMTEN